MGFAVGFLKGLFKETAKGRVLPKVTPSLKNGGM
jgi:hypothetical protein